MLCSAAVAQPFFCKPSGGLYSLPYLGEQSTKAAEALSRAEWWELLFFVKKLEAQEQEEVTCIIQQEQGEQVWVRACSGEMAGGLRWCSLSVCSGSGHHQERGVCGEPVRADVTPSVQLPEGDEEALIQLSVSVELAQKVLQVLEKRCQGSAQRDLRGSHVYAKYSLSRGAEQDGSQSTAVSSEGAGWRSPEATVAEAAKEELSTAAELPRAPAVAMKSDSQLFSELLEREGLFLPEVTEEQSKGNGLLRAGAHAGFWSQLHCL